MEEKVCSNCRWYEELPFADEGVCVNPNSEYADCPTDYPDNDTCEEWGRKIEG